MTNSEPKIIIFRCNWSTDATVACAPENNPRIIKTMCSGKIEPTFVLNAFSSGADGVMIIGCQPGDCHYNTGNYKTARRVMLLKKMLPQFGIDPERLRFERFSPSEAAKAQAMVDNFTKQVTKLGPLGMKNTVKAN